MPQQLPLPLPVASALGRKDFIVAPANAQAVAFVDAYPNWPAPAVALYGPPGSGKSHLARAWAEMAGATTIEGSMLSQGALASLDGRPLVVENVDLAEPAARDGAVFALLNRGSALVLTAREPPPLWPVLLPDLASRFRALLAFPLWEPDDSLLEALAEKLFSDRQLAVPRPVIRRIVAHVERAPGAIRDFVAHADAMALAEKSPVSLALVRKLLPAGTAEGA